jgi:HEPN domain-containing protein
MKREMLLREMEGEERHDGIEDHGSESEEQNDVSEQVAEQVVELSREDLKCVQQLIGRCQKNKESLNDILSSVLQTGKTSDF